MNERADELAALATREVGKLIGDSNREVRLAADILKWYAENGPRLLEPKRIEGQQPGIVTLVGRPGRESTGWHTRGPLAAC